MHDNVCEIGKHACCNFCLVCITMHILRCSILLPLYHGLCVCLLDTLASHTKMAELTEMPFGMWTVGA